MATRKRRVKRPRKVRPVVKEVEEDILEEELQEEVAPAPKPRRRRKAKVVEPEPEEEEYDEDEYEDEEPEPAPKPRRRRKVKVIEPEPEPELEVAEVTDLDVFYGLLENLDDGDTLTITRTGEETWTVSSGDAAPTAPAVQKLRGAAFLDEVCTPEYRAHEEEWTDLTLAEKKQAAKKLKVKWEGHADARVDNIRMTQAVRKHLGIEKFKPQYTGRAARAAIRG